MSAHFVCVRFFLGYTASFPFDRFLHLKDHEIGSSVEALAKEWWNKPTNRKYFQESETRRLEKQREWLQAGLAVPPGNSFARQRTRDDVVELPARPTGTPTVEQIIVAAGWGAPALCGQYGITDRYPVARYSTEESANIATTALQGRVSELARSTETKERWSGSDSLLATANPHFIAVPESSLCSAEKAALREKIDRVYKSPGQHPSLEEGLLRFYLSELRGTLDQVQESDLPTNKQGASQPSIHYLGQRTFRVENGAAWSVSEREDCLLQAFIR
jgi:hypothetical protein